jgi:hypothetical protein
VQSLLPVPSVMEVLCAAWSCARIRLLPCSFSPCSCWMYWLCWLSRNKFAAALVFDIPNGTSAVCVKIIRVPAKSAHLQPTLGRLWVEICFD